MTSELFINREEFQLIDGSQLAMQPTQTMKLLQLAFHIAIAFTVFSSSLVAQEKQSKDQNAKADAAATTNEDTKNAASATPKVELPPWPELKVPNTKSLEELAKFVAETKSLQPTTEARYREMQKAILEASKRIIELTKDRTTPAFRVAEFDYVSSSVLLLGNDGPEAQKKTYERFRDYLKGKPKPDDNDLRMVLLAGQNLEQIADGKMAGEAYLEFAKILKEKKNETFQVWIGMLEANANRMQLPGKEMKVTGKMVTGDEFKIESCRGKFTLVYFWASFDSSCKQEYPYMKKLYLDYRDKGFEIVAISVDEDREKLDAFIRENEVPWINLWDEENRSAPVAVQQYGISAIPTMILLDREGKVVSMEARGLILGRLLDKFINRGPETSDEPAKQDGSTAKP